MTYDSHLWAPGWAFTPPLGTPPKRQRTHTDTHAVTQAAGPRTLQVTDADTVTQAQLAITQALFADRQELFGNLVDPPCTQYAHLAAGLTLSELPDDVLRLVLDACSSGAGVPRFEEVKGLVCSKALLQQLHRLHPLVGVESLSALQLHRLRQLVGDESLSVLQLPTRGPWRLELPYMGRLTMAVMAQARKGSVRSIDARQWRTVLSPWASLTPSVAMRVVPELLGVGCSLLELNLRGVPLNSTWVATFGKAAVCSTALRSLRLESCGLQGPLPELRLPALQNLNLGNNQLTGGLEPLRKCTALKVLDVAGNELEPRAGLRTGPVLIVHGNQLTGSLEPLRGCTGLQTLKLGCNLLTGGLEPLQDCTALRSLSLQNNQFTGGLEPLRRCTALQSLSLQNNQFTGGLEPLRRCTALQSLNLFPNHRLTGGLEPLRGCTALPVARATLQPADGWP